jgi:Putative lumazine-binding
MKRILISGFAMVLLIGGVSAQSSQDSIKAIVNQLFEGMKSSDAAMVQSAFADSAVLQSVAQTRDGKISIENDQVAAFASLIGGLKKGAADEQIVFARIEFDGPLAMVWAPYKFYFDGKFSHCGVDSFQLVRINGHWKIQYLIDTRRRQGCQP